MAYGIEAVNSNNEKVIQADLPMYVKVRSGTLYPVAGGGWNGIYSYMINGTNAEPSGSEETFYTTPVGSWVSYFPFGLPSGNGRVPTGQMSTTQTTLEYTVFDSITNVGPSSDTYGMRVYNSSGALCYDSGRETARVSDNVSLFSTHTHPQTQTINSTGNCVATRSPFFSTFNSTNVYGNAMRRISSTQWVSETRVVNGLIYNNAYVYDYNGLMHDVGVNALIGHV